MSILYSIGYGNRAWEDFLLLLQSSSCQFLIDVRSNPYSKFNPEYNREKLKALCAKARIRYVFMGDALGGKPGNIEAFDPNGKVDYERLAEAAEFKVGLARLEAAHSKGLVSFVMCSELKPEMCHRCKLIGMRLDAIGIEIMHVDENDRHVTQSEVVARLTGGQDDFFGLAPNLTRSRGRYGRQ